MQAETVLQSGIAVQIVEKARVCGASMAGVVRVSELRGSPSFRAAAIDESWLREGQSILVLALEHPIKNPELDWWGTKGGTQGNQRLKDISERVKFRWSGEIITNQEKGERVCGKITG